MAEAGEIFHGMTGVGTGVKKFVDEMVEMRWWSELGQGITAVMQSYMRVHA